MSDVHYLSLEDAARLIKRLGVGPVRDVGLLDSALARPRSSAFGQDAYPTLSLKAAALLHSLVKNHSLVDGNKRLAWSATYVFLVINDLDTALTTDEAYDFILGVAAGSMELADIASGLKVVSSTGAPLDQ